MKKDKFDKAIERLERPFAVRDIEWVPNFTYGDNNYQDKVIAVAPYVRRESVITRLNVVLGPGNWENMVEPLGKYGLYQGIAVNKEGYWVRKFDGSQMNDSGGRIDAVKGVVSKSLRRGGEVWGVGLYLQFVPQLYAVKRPSDYYDAQEVWSDNNNNLKIRWDPPQMPKMFLPEYMTPEQYVRMKRIVRYFSEEKQEAAKELIRKWEEDPESISYEKAQQTVGLVWDRVIDRLNSMDNRQIIDPRTKDNNDKNPPSQKNGTPKGQSESKGSKKQEPKEEKENEVPENAIRAKRWKELRKMVKDLEKLDEDAIWYEKDWLEELKSKIVAHRNQVEYITIEDYEKYQKSISEIIDTIDDDLPF